MLIDILVGRGVGWPRLVFAGQGGGTSEWEANANLRNLGFSSCQKSELNSVQDQVKANVAFLYLYSRSVTKRVSPIYWPGRWAVKWEVWVDTERFQQYVVVSATEIQPILGRYLQTVIFTEVSLFPCLFNHKSSGDRKHQLHRFIHGLSRIRIHKFQPK